MSAFVGVGTAPGVTVWRLEDFEPVIVPESEHGKFYAGDSYIVLHSFKAEKVPLGHDIFFWLGAETSQDESAAAAMLSVKLDEALGGSAVQHREVCGQETDDFKQVFRSIKVLQGGKASALRRAEEGEYTPSLIQVKTGAGVVAVEVPMSMDSLNTGDCFILDTAEAVYLYQGEHASIKERMKSMDVAVAVRDEEHAGEGKVLVVDTGDFTSEAALAFFTALGAADPSAVSIPDAPPADADAAVPQEPRLYTTSSGAFTEVAAAKLTPTLLASDSTFLVAATGVVWVWTGKHVPLDDRALASEMGAQFVKQQALPASTAVKVTKEGLEPTLFKSNFDDWSDNELKAYDGEQLSTPAPPPQAFPDNPPMPSELDTPAVVPEPEAEFGDSPPAAAATPSNPFVGMNPFAESVPEPVAAVPEPAAVVPEPEDVLEVVPEPVVEPPPIGKQVEEPEVKTRELNGGANGEAYGDANGVDEEVHEDSEIAEDPELPKISVSALRKQMLENDAQAKANVYSPKSSKVLGERTWENGKAGSVDLTPTSPPGSESPSRVLSAHDLKNTANVAVILQQGTFEKVPLQDFIPYKELMTMRLEDGIDVTRKEDYLDDEEFETVFGISRDEFKKMPAWRQIQNKKKVILF